VVVQSLLRQVADAGASSLIVEANNERFGRFTEMVEKGGGDRTRTRGGSERDREYSLPPPLYTRAGVLIAYDEGLGVFQGGPGLTRGPKVVVFVFGLGRPKLEGGIQMIGECATDVQSARTPNIHASEPEGLTKKAFLRVLV